MIERIYIDTSVIGGCIDQEFKVWSIALFNEFKNGNKIAVISDITLDESPRKHFLLLAAESASIKKLP
jgi:hypothetical protein